MYGSNSKLVIPFLKSRHGKSQVNLYGVFPNIKYNFRLQAPKFSISYCQR